MAYSVPISFILAIFTTHLSSSYTLQLFKDGTNFNLTLINIDIKYYIFLFKSNIIFRYAVRHCIRLTISLIESENIDNSLK